LSVSLCVFVRRFIRVTVYTLASYGPSPRPCSIDSSTTIHPGMPQSVMEPRARERLRPAPTDVNSGLFSGTRLHGLTIHSEGISAALVFYVIIRQSVVLSVHRCPYTLAPAGLHTPWVQICMGAQGPGRRHNCLTCGLPGATILTVRAQILPGTACSGCSASS
jgi:hypothetical protein